MCGGGRGTREGENRKEVSKLRVARVYDSASPTHTHIHTPEEGQGPLPLPHTTVPFCDPPDILSYTTAEPGDTGPSAGLEDRDHSCVTTATKFYLLSMVSSLHVCFSGVARSQTTPGHWTRLFVCLVGGGLGACFPSKFLHLRGSYSDCS